MPKSERQDSRQSLMLWLAEILLGPVWFPVYWLWKYIAMPVIRAVKKRPRSTALVIAMLVALPALAVYVWVLATEFTETDKGSVLRSLSFIAVAAIGFPFLVWRSMAADQQAEATRKQAEISENENRQNRFERGVAMLDSDSISTRRVGIRTLAYLASTYASDFHIPAMESLCDFLRYQTKQELPLSALGIAIECPADIEAVAKVIGGRSAKQKELEKDWSLILENVNLSRASIYSSDFSGVWFGHAKFAGAILSESNFSQVHASSVNLSYAFLRNSSLEGAYLSFARFLHTNLLGANLRRARLYRANFSDAEFGKSDDMHYILQDKKVTLNLKTDSTDLSGADLTKVEGLTQSQLDASAAKKGNPPTWEGDLICAETGKPLKWNGKNDYD